MKRRNFLQFLTAAGVSSPFLIPSSCLGDDEKAAASERVNIGCIGVGGRGAQVFRMMMSCSNAQVVAVADCYKSRRESISRACGGKGFLDFREILEMAQKVKNETIVAAEAKAAAIVAKAEEEAADKLGSLSEEKEKLTGQVEALKTAAAEYRAKFEALLQAQQEAMEKASDLF